MNNRPHVSIGLPVYNGEKYLKQALLSILSQSYTDFELIISDNASTDRTQAICQAYAAKDPRIRYYFNEKNLGAAPNHNRVFELASGEYFKWAGYDDIITADFLQRCVEVLDLKPEVVLCMPKTSFIDEHGNYIGDQPIKIDISLTSPHERFGNLVQKLEVGDFIYGLMRSDAIRKTSLHGSYPSADLVFETELALYGQFYIIPESLFFRRKHSEQSIKGKYAIERNRVAWFDTSLESKITLPKWLYLSGYLRAIRNAPLTRRQRLFCYLQMVRWVLKPAHFRALGKDILLALNKIVLQKFQIHHKR